MCGIFGYIGTKQNAPTIVLEGLKRLEYRGYDSWGIAAVPQQKTSHKTEIIVKKQTGKIGNATIDDMPPSSFAFGHTRWATHGGITEQNAHPHLDCSNTISVIHNGIIENYETLKRDLIKKGHIFASETDTEVAAHLIEEYIKTMPFDKAVRKAFNMFEGFNAIIAISSIEQKFVAVRNGSPLVIGVGNNEHVLASDASAILPHTSEVHFLQDGEMAVIQDEKMSLYEAKTGKHIDPTIQRLSWSISQAEKGTYPHYMIKEIHEQPEILATIAEHSVSDVKKLAAIIASSYGGYMIGCGSAAYACLAGTYLFSKIAKRHMNWAIGSEFSYQQDFLTKKSLVIALSQSGETMDTLEAVKQAKAKGALIVALVNVMGSTLYREADHAILLSAGPEKGVASTKAFTAKLAHLILLATALADDPDRGTALVKKAALAVNSLLKKRSLERIEAIAEGIEKKEHIYVIGRGLSYPASLETALKIKEVSYIHAEGLPAGELKHGPLALVEQGTPCIAFLPNDETYSANLAGAMEMKARGGHIIGVSYKKHELFDTYIHVDDAEEATIIPQVVVGQILGYHLAVIRGFDPDMPRNLAKSVTVK